MRFPRYKADYDDMTDAEIRDAALANARASNLPEEAITIAIQEAQGDPVALDAAILAACDLDDIIKDPTWLFSPATRS